MEARRVVESVHLDLDLMLFDIFSIWVGAGSGQWRRELAAATPCHPCVPFTGKANLKPRSPSSLK
jgi:hypothetical protein